MRPSFIVRAFIIIAATGKGGNTVDVRLSQSSSNLCSQRTTSFNVHLNAGVNTIKFSYNGTYAEIDMIDVYQPGVAAAGEFKVRNRNSGKFLEIYQNATDDGALAVQWGDTGVPGQIWSFESAGSGYYRIVNKNSDKLLEVGGASTADGAAVNQWGNTNHHTQQWSLQPTSDGYYKLPNRNSGKLLEVYQNATSDGASVVQWSDTGANGQQWTLVKEGIQ